EHGFGHSHAQIRALDQHEAPTHGKTVDGSDHRLLQRAVHERIRNCRSLAAGRAARKRFLHVLAGAEATSGAGEDRKLQVLVVPELGPQFSKGSAHLAIEGIEPLRAVHAKDKDLSVTLAFDDCHATISTGFCAAEAAEAKSRPVRPSTEGARASQASCGGAMWGPRALAPFSSPKTVDLTRKPSIGSGNVKGCHGAATHDDRHDPRPRAVHRDGEKNKRPIDDSRRGRPIETSRFRWVRRLPPPAPASPR